MRVGIPPAGAVVVILIITCWFPMLVIESVIIEARPKVIMGEVVTFDAEDLVATGGSTSRCAIIGSDHPLLKVLTGVLPTTIGRPTDMLTIVALSIKTILRV